MAGFDWFQLYHAVWSETSGLSACERSVMAALLKYTNNTAEGQCRVPMAALVACSGWSKPSVCRALVRLERAGWLSRISAPPAAAEYRLSVPSGVVEGEREAGRAGVEPSHPETVPSHTETIEESLPSHTETVTVSHRDDTVSHRDDTVSHRDSRPAPLLPPPLSPHTPLLPPLLSPPEGKDQERPKDLDPRTGGIRALGEQTPQARARPRAGDAPPYTPDFETFWAAYPRRVGKGAAFAAWRQLRPGAETQQRILGALAAQRECVQWQREGGRYVPHPATWLRQRRWEDAPDPAGEGVMPARASPQFEPPASGPGELARFIRAAMQHPLPSERR